MNLDSICQEVARIDAAASPLPARSAALADEATGIARRARKSVRVPWSIQLTSSNRKLAPIREEIARSGRRRFVGIGPFCVSTYVSIASTCPDSCTFKNNGCYAQAGSAHLTMGTLDLRGRGYTPLEVTQGEAAALSAMWKQDGRVPQDGARGGRDLRLHVGGDASCRRGARALGDAVAELQRRGLGSAWTYTHRWREIPRAAWGPISVLASVETVEDAELAVARGYAPAMTVEAFPSRRAWRVSPRLRLIPCPYEAGGSGPTCVQCRLCLDRDLLRMGSGIAFAVHGAQAEQATVRLRVVR